MYWVNHYYKEVTKPRKGNSKSLVFFIPPAFMLVSAAKGQVFRVRRFHSQFTELPNTDLSCTNAATRVTLCQSDFKHGSLGVPFFGKGWSFKDRSHSQVLYLCAFPIWTKLAKMEHPWIQNTCTRAVLDFVFFGWMNWSWEFEWWSMFGTLPFFNITQCSSSFILPSYTYGSLNNVFLALPWVFGAD